MSFVFCVCPMCHVCVSCVLPVCCLCASSCLLAFLYKRDGGRCLWHMPVCLSVRPSICLPACLCARLRTCVRACVRACVTRHCTQLLKATSTNRCTRLLMRPARSSACSIQRENADAAVFLRNFCTTRSLTRDCVLTRARAAWASETVAVHLWNAAATQCK